MKDNGLSTTLYMVFILCTFSANNDKDRALIKAAHAFDNDLQIVRRYVGDQVIFDCKVSNVTQAVWQQSTDMSSVFLSAGSSLNGDKNLHISIDTFSLQIAPVYQEDEGTYTCMEEEKTQAKYLLIVKTTSPCYEEGRKSCENCCTSDVIQKDLAELQKVNSDNVEEIAEQLEKVSNHVEYVDADNLKSIVHILNDIVNTNTSEKQVTKVTESVLHIASNVMGVKNEVIDEVSDVRNVPHLLEQQAATIHSYQKNYFQVLDNVGFSAVQINQSTLQNEVTFGSLSDNSSTEHDIPPSLSKNRTVLHYHKPSTNTISSITLPRSIFGVTDNGKPNTTTIPLTFLIYRDASMFLVKGRPNQFTKAVISSHVISAKVAQDNIEIKNLPDDSQISTTFYSFPTVDNEEKVIEQRECVFWKYNESDGTGEWSTDGCRKVEDSRETRQVKCLCNHLTSFAVLVHVRVVGHSSPYYVELIFRIGCVLSIVGLVFCILTILMFRSVRNKQPSLIHLNLCIALAGLYLTFLLGIDKTTNPLRCKVAATLIQFLALSSMAWMSVEAFNLCLLFLMMRRSPVNHLVQISSLAAWGGPLLVSVLVFFFDKSVNYNGRLPYCFLQPGNGLYFGFILLIGLLFLFNCIVFLLIMYRVIFRKVFATNEEAKRKERFARLRGSFLFWVLLGMSWGFGFLSIIIPPLRFGLEILFAVCLTLQGVCMFYMIIIKNHEVKKAVMKTTNAARYSLRESIRMKKWRYVPGDSYMAYIQSNHKVTSAISASAAETVDENDNNP